MKHKKHKDDEDYRHSPRFFQKTAFIEGLIKNTWHWKRKLILLRAALRKETSQRKHSKSSAFHVNGPMTKSEGQSQCRIQ